MIKLPGIGKSQKAIGMNISQTSNGAHIEFILPNNIIKTLDAYPADEHKTISSVINYFQKIKPFVLGFENVIIDNNRPRGTYVNIFVKGKKQKYNTRLGGQVY